jgi:hypothetical protein
MGDERRPCRSPAPPQTHYEPLGALMSTHSGRRGDENRLQGQLRDLIALAVVGDHVRWVLTDDDPLRNWLVEAVSQWRALADRVAIRLAASGVAPAGRVRSLAQDITVNWVPGGWLSGDEARVLLNQRLASMAARAHYRRSEAIGPDADVLAGVSAALEAAKLPARQEFADDEARRENLSRNASARAARLRDRD